jgi:predicted O-methyltransferase YrrM
MVLGSVGFALVAYVGVLVAQPSGGRRAPGVQMRQWLDDLERAYEQKDMDRIGELVGQMKQRRQQLQGRAGQGRPDGPPPEMRGAGARPGRPGFGLQRAGQPIESKDPLARSDFEKTVLAVLDDMDRNQRRGMMNVPELDGRLLRLLAESVGARHIIEIGTSNGYSGIWQCLALKATGGKLTTFEIDEGRASLARQNFKKAGVDDIVTLVFGDAHEKVAGLDGPIDILFLDADKEGYIDYLNKLLPKVRPGGLIIAHNVNPRQADARYVEAITTDPDLETLILNHTGGISVTLKKRDIN